MPQGRPPVSTTTRLYGHFAHQTEHRPQPVAAVVNALLDQRGVDALYIPLQVPAEHFAAVVAGMRYLRDFAGFTVTMPHKVTAARLCDTLLPNAQACGAVNAVRIDPDGRLIGEIFDGVAMVQAIRAHRAIDATTADLFETTVPSRAYGHPDFPIHRRVRPWPSDAVHLAKCRRPGERCGSAQHRDDGGSRSEAGCSGDGRIVRQHQRCQ